jgi:hypothetical protein
MIISSEQGIHSNNGIDLAIDHGLFCELQNNAANEANCHPTLAPDELAIIAKLMRHFFSTSFF